MNILTHQNWAGDSKLDPEVMDALGIEPASNWDTRAWNNNLGRMTEAQRQAWEEVYGPMNEEFKKNYPGMSGEELMRWRYQRYMQDYLACIAAVDEGVGELLDYLEEEGLDQNTVVVYTSDQGFYLGEHGWFDKRFIYDESFKTPLLVKWPGVVDAGSRSDQMVQNLDFAQTFLEIAGIEAPGDMQGESLVPLLKGEDDRWQRDAVYYHYYEYPAVHMVKRHYGIVTREYKLAHFYYDVDEWELYDRIRDPLELKNEVDNPEYAEVVNDLKKRLEQLRVKYKDSRELDQQFIDLYEVE
jgi:arylsulfatase A-like enzyme